MGEMVMKHAFALVLAGLACVACTSPVKVVRVDPNKPETRVGVAYHLPFSRFEVSITRMVTGCEANTISLSTSVDAALAEAAIDPEQSFTIDPNSLAGVFRVSALKAEYGKAGLVKSLNASADDHTAQVLLAAVGGIVKLATLPIGIPVASINSSKNTFGFVGSNKEEPSPDSKAQQKTACSDATYDALQRLPEAAAELKQASNELTVAAAAYKALQERVTALGGVVDEATRRALVEARGRADDAAIKLANKKASVDKLKESLSHTQTFFWPPNGSTFDDSKSAPSNLLALWKSETVDVKGAVSPVKLRLIVDPSLPEELPRPMKATDAVSGVPYRMPASGFFMACDGDCTPANQLAVVKADVLQLGALYYLPCQSQTFGSTACTLTADENGVPTAAGTETKASAAENAAGAFKDLTTQYSAMKESRRDAQKVAYEAEAARLKAKAEYEKALASPVTTAEEQSLASRTTVLKAYVDYYTAVKDFTDAKNAAAAP